MTLGPPHSGVKLFWPTEVPVAGLRAALGEGLTWQVFKTLRLEALLHCYRYKQLSTLASLRERGLVDLQDHSVLKVRYFVPQGHWWLGDSDAKDAG